MVEPRGSASEEPAARTFKEAAGTVSVGRHVEHGTLNLLLMQKKNRMSDSLLLWE